MVVPAERARGAGFPRIARAIFAVGLLVVMMPGRIVEATVVPWSPAAHTLQQHVWASAATGADGRIYVFGDDSIHDPRRQPSPGGFAEVYTPSTNRWTKITRMPTARSRTAAATARDGTIYVLGGLGTRGASRTAEAYTPRTGTWATVAPMPIGGYAGAAATGPDGKIYVFGGFRNRFGADGHGDLDAVQIYDPMTNAWTVNHSMPVPLQTLSAVTGSDGRVYIMGGWNGTLAGVESRVWAFSTSTGTFTQVASMPKGRETFGAAAGSNGTIYVIAGHTSQGDLTAVDAYSIATGTWRSLPSLPAAESELSAAWSGNTIYAIGGTGPHSDTIHGTKSVWSLTP